MFMRAWHGKTLQPRVVLLHKWCLFTGIYHVAAACVYCSAVVVLGRVLCLSVQLLHAAAELFVFSGAARGAAYRQ